MDSEFSFNFKKSKAYKAVQRERSIFFRFTQQIKILFVTLFILSSLLFLYGFLLANFLDTINQKLLGFMMISMSLAIFFRLIEAFIQVKIKNIKPLISLKDFDSKQQNLADLLSFDTAKAVLKSIKFAQSKKLREVDSSILFYFTLADNRDLDFIFNRSTISPKDIKRLLSEFLRTIKNQKSKDYTYSENFKNTLLEALQLAKKREHRQIEIFDILPALAKNNDILKSILIDNNLKPDDIENLSEWLERIENKLQENRKFWEWKNLLKLGSLAKEWAAGYTVTLDKFSTDITRIIKRTISQKIIGHKTEIESLERILSREEKNNALIVGEVGSGRKSMVHALAMKSLFSESLPNINNKRFVRLDLAMILTQVDSTEEAGNLLEAIFNEIVSAGNVILVVDEIHNFLGSKTMPGVMNISGVLGPYLASPLFQIIGITTFTGLHKYIEQNPSMLGMFEKVEITEISNKETLMILEDMVPFYEAKYKKFIPYQTLREIIVLCDKYLPNNPFPEKAVSFLDEIVIYSTQVKEAIVTPKQVAKIVSDKTQIPVGEAEAKEREMLLNLEKLIHERIINQEQAVKEVSSALRRARARVAIKKGPMGAFLFLGPTGVGKTETSKALADIYFGSEKRMIRIDMSEFQNTSDIPRLIGSIREEGLLTTQTKENPFSLILLDEIEKAHPNILNLFLQVLDEGHITDGLGRKIDFKNTIIVCTSNAGYRMILEAIKKDQSMDKLKDELLDYLFKEGIFRPEFINRFDEVILFKQLNQEHLLAIAGLLLQKVKQNLAKKDIELTITEYLKARMVELGYDKRFGAREIRRVIQDKIENALAQALLSGQIKRGDSININPDTFEIEVKP